MITHDDLIKIGAKWLEKQHNGVSSCGVILTEFKSFEISIPDVIGFNNHCSVVVECKISHADFLADLKKIHRAKDNLQQCGNYRYYLTLPDVIKSEEVKNGWGLLYYIDEKVKIILPPVLHDEPEIKVAEYSILYSIARRASDQGLLNKILLPYTTCAGCRQIVNKWTQIKWKGDWCDKCLNEKEKNGKSS